MIIFSCKFPLLLFHKKLAGLSLPPIFVFLIIMHCYFSISVFLWEFIRVPFFCRMKILTPFPVGLKSPLVICSDIGLWKGVGRKSCHVAFVISLLAQWIWGFSKGPLFFSCETCKLAFENWKSNWCRITFIFMKFKGKKSTKFTMCRNEIVLYSWSSKLYFFHSTITIKVKM